MGIAPALGYPVRRLAGGGGVVQDEDGIREAIQLATGKVIRELLKRREAAGEPHETTLAWLSEAASIPTATLTRLVAGRTVVTLHGLYAIATVLGLSLTDVVALIEETLSQSHRLADEQLPRSAEATGSVEPWWTLAAKVGGTVLGGIVGLGAAMAVSERLKRAPRSEPVVVSRGED